LTKFRIEAVFADGELVAEKGRMVKELPRFSYPEKFMKSVKLPHTIKPEEFEMRVMGQNIEAARYAGIRLGRTLLTGSLVAGGLAGIGGLVIVSGIIGRLRPGASPGYGYTAIIIAFLSGLNPWLALPASVFFGGLLVAGDVIQSTLNLPFAAVQIFQATIFLMIILGEFFKRYRVRVVR
jgi:simple sugar transport system permease protein